MVSVEPIEAGMFPELYRSLLHAHDRRLGEEDWRRAFLYRWETGSAESGFALVDGSEIVGVLGTIFSSRIIDDKPERFCNLHTWIVKDAHRGQSLALLRPILRLTDHTVTDLTPTQSVYAIERRLGFVDLDERLRVLLPLPGSREDACDGAQLTGDATEIEARLNEADARILRDHRGQSCGHLLMEDGGAYCYVVYTKVGRAPLTCCFVHYVSHPRMLEQKSACLRSALLRHSGARLLALDSRLLPPRGLPASFDFPLRLRRLYRTPGLAPNRVDSLYSELILLGLSGFPYFSLGLTRLVRQAVRRLGLRPRDRA